MTRRDVRQLFQAVITGQAKKPVLRRQMNVLLGAGLIAPIAGAARRCGGRYRERTLGFSTSLLFAGKIARVILGHFSGQSGFFASVAVAIQRQNIGIVSSTPVSNVFSYRVYYVVTATAPRRRKPSLRQTGLRLHPPPRSGLPLAGPEIHGRTRAGSPGS